MTATSEGEATRPLLAWSDGDEGALGRLMPLVYDELHPLASGYLRRERRDHTLQATALVHEAYLRMIDQRSVHWRSTLHFVALAAQMMRRILVDHARKHRYAKRGGGAAKVSLEDAPQIAGGPDPDLVELDDAMRSLAEVDPQLGRIVELRFFGGMSHEEIAELLDISVPTVSRRWRLARAWLHRALTGTETDRHGT